ncbi:MAG: transglutaminase [Ruminococcus sp.]|nr:transglutaminase [Ruminococcus sp.]
MKRIIAILLVSAVSLSMFTSCGEEDAFADVTTDVADYTYSSEETEEEPEESTEEPESESGIYDNTAVVESYKTGDTSALSSDDLLILQAASDAIAVFYTDGMSDYEIVLAAHDYITTHVTYDLDELNLIGSAKSDSSTPFGALIYGEAICMGYTTTFQLMMDMLGVESIIVSGSSDGEDHAWNMVCLDDKWYHVDCTWDDFVPDYEGRRAFHTYFMVTDGVMAIDHVWDMDSTPTADSEDCVYFFTQGLYAETIEELKTIIESETASGDLRAEAAVPLGEDLGIPSLENASIYAYWQNDFDTYSVVIYYLE